MARLQAISSRSFIVFPKDPAHLASVLHYHPGADGLFYVSRDGFACWEAWRREEIAMF
jgi:hypothetical protein